MELSSIWSNGMVLQRGRQIPLIGRTDGEKVVVRFLGKSYEAAAKANGYFEILLDCQEAGGPYEMKLEDGETRYLSDILIGDVWLLGGQSNMALPVSRTLDCTRAEIDGKREANIRMFAVKEQVEFNEPREILTEGEWIGANSHRIMEFSAAGYFFARELVKNQDVPIGLIQTAVGGTPVESWMSEESLKCFEMAYEELQQAKNPDYVRSVTEADAAGIEEWFQRLNRLDKGESDWEDAPVMKIPGLWKGTSLAGHCGSVWFQKEVEIPEDWQLDEAELRLGAIVDADETYINGMLVGHTDYRYPPRNYKIPSGVLKHGNNKITVRVVCQRGRGGFVEGKFYGLREGEKEIALEGPWHYRIGTVMELLPEQMFFRRKPAGLYKGMIYPLRDVKIKGVAFYQGESNSDDPEDYHIKFKAMVEDWRRLFGQKELPFLYVQLANYDNEDGIKDGFAKIREEQRRCLDIPHTAMAVTVDIGEYNDLHPQNKLELGRRLALLAEKLVYGKPVVSSGPMFKKIIIEEKKLRLKFDCTGSGLMVKGINPLQLLITFGDGQVRRITPTIEGDDLVIPILDERCPVEVSYGFADNPIGIRLYNREGLPASPFKIR